MGAGVNWPLMSHSQQVSLYHIIREHGHPQSVTAGSRGEVKVNLGAVTLTIDAGGVINA